MAVTVTAVTQCADEYTNNQRVLEAPFGFVLSLLCKMREF